VADLGHGADETLPAATTYEQTPIGDAGVQRLTGGRLCASTVRDLDFARDSHQRATPHASAPQPVTLAELPAGQTSLRPGREVGEMPRGCS
jgi:hypothetical protein